MSSHFRTFSNSNVKYIALYCFATFARFKVLVHSPHSQSIAMLLARLFNGETRTIRHGDPQGGILFGLFYILLPISTTPIPSEPPLSHPPQAFYLPPHPSPFKSCKIQKLYRNYHFLKAQHVVFQE